MSWVQREQKQREKQSRQAKDSALKAEILLPTQSGSFETEGLERTWRFTQEQLKEHMDERSAKKAFNMDLKQYGPYNMRYTRNGRHLLLGGRKGHIAIMDWSRLKLSTELHVNETIRDVTFLHSEEMFAVAQKKYVYIYDKEGTELHCLRNHFDVNCLDFLPFHYLLTSIGKSGHLKYQDTSTGAFVTQIRTKQGECKVMKQNPRNAVVHLGHNNGLVTLWSPNMAQPLVKMMCHKASVLAMSIDASGNYMVTSGLDGQARIWDVRTYKQLHSFFTPTPAATLDISSTGTLALGFGPNVQVWKDAFRVKPKDVYMREVLQGKSVRNVRFCPYEDVLGVSHSQGFSSLVIPGSGEANFDSREANPYENKKAQRERVVHSLLEKLQPDMITLDLDAFGVMDKNSAETFQSERKAMRETREFDEAQKKAQRDKKRGGQKSTKKYKRRRKNIIDRDFVARKAKIEAQERKRRKRKEQMEKNADPSSSSALDRF